MLSSQVWYCPFSPDSVDVAKWWLLSDNHLATTLFFTVIFQQHISAWVFSFGSTYQPSIVTDRFRISSGTNVVGLPDIPMPMSFRWKLLAMLLGNVFTCILFEYVVVLGPVRSYFRNKYHTDLIPMKK
eukprot:jgi/Phyca11/543901/estExt2_Genewise1Plus.C_PHYCAscaffold_130281